MRCVDHILTQRCLKTGNSTEIRTMNRHDTAHIFTITLPSVLNNGLEQLSCGSTLTLADGNHFCIDMTYHNHKFYSIAIFPYYVA